MAGDDRTTRTSIPKNLLEQGARSAYLLVLSAKGGSSVGRMLKLDRPEIVLGRGSNVDIPFDDDGISRRHAKLLREDEHFRLVDLGSRNGTMVNGKLVDSVLLASGDKIQLGSTTVLLFTIQDQLQESFQRSLYESATRDGLTRLLNRRAALDILATEFAYSARHQVPVSVAMMDIDRFKPINDTYGHLAGDQVLVGVAQCLMTTLRTEDILCRYGGEEFLLILRETDMTAALQCAERCRKVVEGASFPYRDNTIKVTLSAGVTTLTLEGPNTVEELIAEADKCLYEAKGRGRNQTYAAAAKKPPAAPPKAKRERRIYARIETNLSCRVDSAKGPASARLIDLSPTGGLLIAPSGIATTGDKLKLQLPADPRQPTALDSRVMWTHDRASETAYGLLFEDLNAEQKGTVQYLLELALESSGQGTRKHPRVRKQARLQLRGLDQIYGAMVDISRGGIGFTSEVPLHMHEEITVDLTVEEFSTMALPLRGRVKHVRPSGPGEYLAGVQFLPLEKEVQARLDELIRFLLKQPTQS